MSIDELQLRAVRGEAEASNQLAIAYAEGRGVPRDDRTAMLFFQQAADRGHVSAWFNLGMFHELGRGVPADINLAFRCYLKAAERDFPAAQFNVGNMYANGLGVKESLEEAAKWFQKAADQGVPEALFNLGLAYELGRGVRQDFGLARRWYRRAVAQGNVRAMYNLAVMLDDGRGAPADRPDPENALVLYRAAAEQNFGPAQNNLGLMLAEGRGAEENLAEAFAWLSLAVQNGVNSGALEVVAQRMSTQTRREAEALVANLKGEPPPTGVDSTTSSELAALQSELAGARAELAQLRAEYAQLAEAVKLVQQNGASSSPPPSLDLRPASNPGEVDLRIVQLMAENTRLTDEAKQSRQDISVLQAQLRLLRNTSNDSALATRSAGSNGSSEEVALLQRRIEVMRRTIEKLAEESRARAPLVAGIER